MALEMAVALVIDDDAPIRALAVETLKKAGYVVHEAADGEAGLRRVHELRPDFVVCDVMMPRMNGYQLVAAVRADNAIAATPVVLLTAMSERGHQRLGMISGADDYLSKPYEPRELLESIQAVMERRRAQQIAVLDAVRERMADEEPTPPLTFRKATLLAADLFGWLQARFAGRAGNPELTGRALQSARDTLFLFGADHVLPYGDEILAVFGAQGDEYKVPAIQRAVRAAFRLNPAIEQALRLPSAPTAMRLTVALHVGDFSVLRMHDDLHDNAGYAPVPGTALQAVQGLREFATTRGWEVAASGAALAALPGDCATQGQREAGAVQLHPPLAGTVKS
jgi:DNA-binding response OmpR family regulator